VDGPVIPRLRVFAGPNGSGKSTIYSLLLARGAFHPVHYVNPDDLQELLSNGVPVSYPFSNTEPIRELLRQTSYYSQSGERDLEELSCIEGDLLSGVGLVSADSTGGYLAAALGEAIRSAGIKSGQSIGFETVFSDRRKLDEIDAAREQGYRSYLYFVSTGDPEVNVSRVRDRVLEGGHDVPVDKILSRYGRAMALLPSAIPHFDRVFLFDNFVEYESARLVASITPRASPAVILEKPDFTVPDWMLPVLEPFALDVVRSSGRKKTG
jgi:predicted ABC-type ATPase